MKVGLIAMSGVRVKTAELAELGVSLPGFVERGKVVASLPSLGLLTVAGLTPADVDLAYREVAELPEVGELEEFDLVGISSFTAQIDEAYAPADRYRAQGTPAVLGGIHVSLMPGEAARHADAIVLDGAEDAWPRLMEDFRAGRMLPQYKGARDGVFSSGHYAKPRFDLLAGLPITGSRCRLPGVVPEPANSAPPACASPQDFSKNSWPWPRLKSPPPST